MRRIALDTNAYRALDEGDSVLANHVRRVTEIGLPIIVLGELYAGFFGGTKKVENLSRLERFLETPRVKVLHIDSHTARLFGEIAVLLRQAGKPIQQDDIWIAALCRQHGHVLATRDQGFEHILGLELFRF